MDCLRDYIGVNYCGNTTTPQSGLYVNDLPGVSLRLMTSLTDEEVSTFLTLYTAIQKRAEGRFRTDLRSAMSKYYRIASVNQNTTLGKEITGAATPSSGSKGFTIELTDDVDFTPSPMTYIHVQYLLFYADAGDAGETKTVNIFDLNTGSTLYTTTVTLVAGWNTINVNRSFTGGFNRVPLQIFCSINTSGTSVYSLNPPSDIAINCCGARIRGAQTSETTAVIKSDLTFVSDTAGLSGVFGVYCAWDGLVCNNKDLFNRAYWYCLGVELMTELMYSAKVNSFTTIDRARMIELRNEYGAEYNKELDQVCSNIKLDCDCCIECGDSIQVVTTNQFF